MKSILGVKIDAQTKSEILSNIASFLKQPTDHAFYIVSLNPEILVAAYNNEKLKTTLNSADIRLVDGVGIEIAGNLLKVPTGERIPGADLMSDIIAFAVKNNLRIYILGGYGTTARKVEEILKNTYPNGEFKGSSGYESIQNIKDSEETLIVKEINEFNPNIVFVGYGAPFQESWIESHKQLLKGKVSMTVGGGVDFLSTKVPRAPTVLRNLGLEWLFRLIIQPWRLKRQLKLLTFIKLVLAERLKTS